MNQTPITTHTHTKIVELTNVKKKVISQKIKNKKKPNLRINVPMSCFIMCDVYGLGKQGTQTEMVLHMGCAFKSLAPPKLYLCP